MTKMAKVPENRDPGIGLHGSVKGLLPRCLFWSSGYCSHFGAGAVSRLCALLLWCELYDMRDKQKNNESLPCRFQVMPNASIELEVYCSNDIYIHIYLSLYLSISVSIYPPIYIYICLYICIHEHIGLTRGSLIAGDAKRFDRAGDLLLNGKSAREVRSGNRAQRL